jgi:DNA-directed RNA polymerase subunit alpha
MPRHVLFSVLLFLSLSAGPVMARDIEPHGAVRVVHPEQPLFTLQEDRELTGELYVNRGRGYVEASQHPVDRSLPVDLVRIDAIYNPVRRANFTVAETRVGQRTDFDRLTVTVETNGTLTPEDAVAYGAALLQEHYRYFVDFGSVSTVSGSGNGGRGKDSARLRAQLSRPIDDLGLSVRSINSLKNFNISTLGDLVRYTEEELLRVKNVGEKALSEIADLLRRENLDEIIGFIEQQGGLVAAQAAE